ncbi:MAG TPA: hypothetical protein VF148_01980 [Acidimicrobiia bacterium]
MRDRETDWALLSGMWVPWATPFALRLGEHHDEILTGLRHVSPEVRSLRADRVAGA